MINLIVKIFKINILIAFTILLSGCWGYQAIEKIEPSFGIGYDIKVTEDKNKIQSAPVGTVVFNENAKEKYHSFPAYGETLPDTYEYRQKSLPGELLTGPGLVFIFGKDRAKLGIIDIIDGLMRYMVTSYRGLTTVCIGKSEDILKADIKYAAYPAEAIYDLLNNTENHNFAPKVKLYDLYYDIFSLGRNPYLPVIQLKENRIEYAGGAIFKKDKLYKIVDIQESRLIGILRGIDSKGAIILSDEEENFKMKYIGVSGNFKRKVKVDKNKDNFIFNISLKFNGSITRNTKYEGLFDDSKKVLKLEEDLSKYIEENLQSEINKIQNEYKVDCIDISKYAIAKYGRSNMNWDKVMCDSEVKVKVDSKIVNIGRAGIK